MLQGFPDMASSGSFDISDMTNTCGCLSICIAGGHVAALPKAVPSKSHAMLDLRAPIST